MVLLLDNLFLFFQHEDLQRLFETFDCDMNGRISRRELKAVFKALNVNISEVDLKNMFYTADTDSK